MVEARVYLENLEADIVTLKEYLSGLETLKDVDNLTVQYHLYSPVYALD
jgi:hypothetical protein